MKVKRSEARLFPTSSIKGGRGQEACMLGPLGELLRDLDTYIIGSTWNKTRGK